MQHLDRFRLPTASSRTVEIEKEIFSHEPLNHFLSLPLERGTDKLEGQYISPSSLFVFFLKTLVIGSSSSNGGTFRRWDGQDCFFFFCFV